MRPTAVALDSRPTRSSFLVFGAPLIDRGAIEEVVDSLESGWIGTGPKVSRFEQELREYVGARRVSCVGSCTAALFLALRALDIGPGDEVIVPAMTFVASANAVEHIGARPVLVDCEPATGLLDFEAAEAAITERTAAIMPVHLAGRAVAMDRLNALRDARGVAVIEDAAHAIGTEWRGRRIGSFGNLTAFSFYVTKNITTIEGGALASSSDEISDRIERLALHGLSLGAWQRYSDPGFKHYEVEEPGFKFNMTDVQASLGLRQLEHLDAWIDYRTELWKLYDELLEGLPLDLPPEAEEGTRHARHLYQVRVTPDAGTTRDGLLAHLGERQIGAGVHYRGVHLQPYYAAKYGIAPEDLPASTRFSEETVSLPLSPRVTEEDVYDVVAAVRSGLLGSPPARAV
jgi:dTDP-4-amino-4,6-dideoxygalactose transaminase